MRWKLKKLKMKTTRGFFCLQFFLGYHKNGFSQPITYLKRTHFKNHIIFLEQGSFHCQLFFNWSKIPKQQIIKMLFYNLRTCVNELWMHARFQILYSQNHNPNSNTVFPRIVSAESIIFCIWKLQKPQIVAANFNILPN